MKSTLTVAAFLRRVAQGERFRIIDLRGSYHRTLPGAIPTLFDPDIFYEEEGWTQQMLGVTFRVGETVLLICTSGNSSEQAVKLFQRKNPKSRFTVLSLQGGMEAYLQGVTQLTQGYRRQALFLEELHDLRTPVERFHHLVDQLWQRHQPKGWKRLLHPSSWL